MSFWTPVESLGTRPLRSWVFDIGCALFAALASFGSFSFAQTPHPPLPALPVSLVVAVLTALVLSLRRVWPGPVFGVVVVMAAVLAQWPVRGALFPVALAIALYTVAVTMSRATALVAAGLAAAAEVPAAGQGGWHNGWLAVIYEVIAIAAVAVAGLYVSTRRAYLAELRDRAQRLEREHDQTSAWPQRWSELASPGRCMTAWLTTSPSSWRFPTVPWPRSPAHPPRPRRRSGACRAPPGRRSPRRAACSASCVPRTALSSASRSPACPTSRACSLGSERPACRSGTNAAVLKGTRRPAFSWSSSGSSRKP